MTYGQRILLVAALMMGFFSYTSAISEVSVEPFGFSVSIEEDAEAEVELVLSNDGDEDVEFSIDSELIEEEENRQAGPRRDDPGDLLDNIDVPGGNCFGITYDYDENLLWGVWHEANSRMLAYDMEGEQQEELRLGITNGIGMAFDGEDLWVGEYGGNRQLYRVDREGEQLQTLNPNCTITGVAWDGENLWIAPYPSNFIRQVNPENGETIRELNTQGMFQSNWITIVYVPEHRDAPLWVFENHGNYFQLNIDEDRPEVVQDFQNQVGNQFGVCHDTENLWTTAPNRWNCYDDGVEEFYMLTFDPEEGVIVGDDAEAVNVLIESTDCEAGVYNILITIELAEPEEERDDPEQSLIEISAVITVGDPTFDLSGIVTDAATDEVVEDVTIEMDSFILIRYSDQDGEYSFDDLPPGEYELTFTAPDYLPTTEGFEIEEDDVELDIALLHSECTPSEDEFFMELEPDMEYVFEWEVDNGGNGPLTYQVERQLLGDASADPWELRQTRNAEEAADDNQLNGVLFIEDHCFISGGNNREDDNKIYIFNRDGELIREFDQFHQSDYGIRDMCWDGELIWGSDDGIIYGFDTDGELVHEIEGEANSYRSLTYDSDEDRFISADITSDIYISNRDGELVQTINRPGDVRTYGLAYWPDDPDDHNL
ncbi:MAG: carboxypeptidase regulatory-like domain-containing protein, partial [Candidatus Hatepunaea meridiana]|nr:carboxypeptidase regulatory-like domain-containing protein [Candidatus Hatepunaea meridiana]